MFKLKIDRNGFNIIIVCKKKKKQIPVLLLTVKIM